MADIVEFKSPTHDPRDPNTEGKPALFAGNVPIPVNMPDLPPMEIGNLGFEDIGAAFNMRGWLQKAVEAAGAEMTGGGFGGGVADISIKLEGHDYWLTIKPMSK